MAWLGIYYRRLFRYVPGFGMTAKPGNRIAAAWNQFEILGAGMIDDRLHQPCRSAGAAQGRIGLDMGKDIAAVMLPVIGENGEIVFDGFETMQRFIVDHRFGSLYIQGNARPMGTIQNRPATT